MTRFEIAHPSASPLANHEYWLSIRLKEINERALGGQQRPKTWERLLILPLTDGDGRCNRLWCYGAYLSSATAHHPLKFWFEVLSKSEVGA